MYAGTIADEGQCVRGSGWVSGVAFYASFAAHLRLGRLGERVTRLLDMTRGNLQLLDIFVSFCLWVSFFKLNWLKLCHEGNFKDI